MSFKLLVYTPIGLYISASARVFVYVSKHIETSRKNYGEAGEQFKCMEAQQLYAFTLL